MLTKEEFNELMGRLLNVIRENKGHSPDGILRKKLVFVINQFMGKGEPIKPLLHAWTLEYVLKEDVTLIDEDKIDYTLRWVRFFLEKRMKQERNMKKRRMSQMIFLDGLAY